ncbi:MAG: hypothetical protein CSA38_00820 [Flavobacteriales bacterium]|nr:MAG: hypothetical protein CSA38_00820 [Flavobacteriales bacterium]
MKKLLLVGFLGALALTSCSTIKKGKQAQQDRAAFLKMKGDWVLTSVQNSKNFRIKPFNEGVDAKCFEGSQWKLVPNNYTGSYTLTNCKSVTQPIKFEVVDGNTFQFKRVHADVKAKSVIAGYKLMLIERSENTFSLKQSIPFDGEVVNVIYNFQRVQK